MVIGGALLGQRSTFRGTTVLKPFDYSQTGKASADVLSQIPVFYYLWPLGCRYAVGIGFSALGGAGQTFTDRSILRYTSTKTMIGIANMGPSFAYQVNNQASVGLGLDVNYITTDLNSMAPTATPGVTPDSKLFNTAKALGYGWHAGLLYLITPPH